MHGRLPRRHLLATVVVALALSVGLRAWHILIPGEALPEAATPGIAREDFTVDFDGFRARAQLTYPEAGTAPFPLVILVAGSGPADMDVTLAGPDGKAAHRLFHDISDHLTLRGYATVRYNKRHVKSATEHPGEEDYAGKVTPQQLQADLVRVYETVAAHPRIDPSRIVVYGWSEGALIATGAVLAHPEIAGLILHAPLSGTYRDLARFQLVELGLPFLREVVDSDRDGYLTEGEIVTARGGEVGVALRSVFPILIERSWLGGTRIRRVLDRDRDDRLAIADEVAPPLDGLIAHWDEAQVQWDQRAYTTTDQPDLVAQQLPRYRGPILLLHGDYDGNIPAADSRQILAALLAAGHDDHTARFYSGLGHTLGPATDRYRDLYAPIAPEVLLDVATWLDQRYR